MVFTITKNLVFIDSNKFMNSRLKKMVNDISGNDFKQITLEFGSENLNFLKQRDAYPYECERF